MGLQCESAIFRSLKAAVQFLETAGVTSLASQTTKIIVPQQCGRPTSTHYRVQILEEQLAKAQSLGWKKDVYTIP